MTNTPQQEKAHPTVIYDFGEWVFVDNDPEDEWQVIQYDVLNNEYTLDKNGKWDYFSADRVSKID